MQNRAYTGGTALSRYATVCRRFALSPTHMGYIRSRKGWYKKYQGQLYQVSCKQLGVPPTKDQSMTAANEWWEAKRAEIDAQEKAATAKAHPRSDEIIEALEANLGVKFNDTDEAQAAFYGVILEHANGTGHLPDWFSEAVLGKARLEQIREGMAALTGAATPAWRSAGAWLQQASRPYGHRRPRPPARRRRSAWSLTLRPPVKGNRPD
jgi:hypothetical protein